MSAATIAIMTAQIACNGGRLLNAVVTGGSGCNHAEGQPEESARTAKVELRIDAQTFGGPFMNTLKPAMRFL